jgi:hypothetical protein
MAVRNALWISIVVVSLAGCDGKPIALAPVTGSVTFAGSVVVRGVIVFTPEADSGTHGGCAMGEIGTDGRYTLSTDGAAGAAPGWHRVTIAGLDSGYGPRLPERFRDPNLSKLRVEVVAGRENTLDFKLEGP